MERREIMVAGKGAPVSHYCDAVVQDGWVFASGVIPVDASGALVGGDNPAAQAEEVFRQLALVLDAAGSSIAEIAKVTIFLTHIGDRVAINPIRQAWFRRAKPASTLVEVSALVHPGARIEIEAIARIAPIRQ